MAKVLMYCTEVCPTASAPSSCCSARACRSRKIRVDLQPELRVAMMEKPAAHRAAIYIGGEHVGGYDDLAALNQAVNWINY